MTDTKAFDPDTILRARAALGQARTAGTSFASIRTTDLDELLERIEFRATEAEQLAEKCAEYRSERNEAGAELARINAPIGPLTPAEWCALRLGADDDPLHCCSFTSGMRDELFLLLRMGTGAEWTHVLADYFAAFDTVCDTPKGHPLIEKIRDFYWPGGVPTEHREAVAGGHAAAVDEDQAREEAYQRSPQGLAAAAFAASAAEDAARIGPLTADEDQADTQLLPVAADAIQMRDVDGVTVYTQPTTFSVSAVPEDRYDGHLWEVQVQYTGAYYFGQTKPENQRWAVRMRGWCLSTAGEWDREPIPSEREETWLAEHRFDLPTALCLAVEHATKVEINGGTVDDALARQASRARAAAREAPRA